MAKLSAFADEVSQNFNEQVKFLVSENIRFIELRFVDGKNVIDLDDEEITTIKQIMNDNGISVSALGSYIGKVRLDESFKNHFDKFRRAVELAHFFNAPFIRIFSYYAPVNDPKIERYREEVVRRMLKKTEFVRDLDVILLHENDSDIYGSTAENCVDLVKSVDSHKLRLAYDPANFVWGQGITKNMDLCWPSMKPYVRHVHIKDWKLGGNAGCLPGKGDAQIKELLSELASERYSGFLTLEPHLNAAGHFGGETGPENFSKSVSALKELCSSVNLQLQ